MPTNFFNKLRIKSRRNAFVSHMSKFRLVSTNFADELLADFIIIEYNLN